MHEEKSDFHWTVKAEEAFKQMKQLIAELSMLTAPIEKEELIVYLAAAKETVSAVLMTEREAKQMPIFFVSRALRGPELNYTSMKKLVLALLHASKRLKRYFQAHPIIVIMDQPIQQILSRPEVVGRLHKRSIELGEYAIHYRPRVSVKGHILADFIVERPEEDSLDTPIEKEEELPEPWILFTDGSSCTDGSRAGLILTNPEGMEFTYALRIAEQMGVKNLQANMDSRLEANQVNGTYVAKEADMIRYLEKVKALTGSFKAFTIKQIPRSENKKDDALIKIASTSFAHLSKQRKLYRGHEKEGPIKRKSMAVYVINGILSRNLSSAYGIKIMESSSETIHLRTGVKNYASSIILPLYPQTNRLVERANRSLCEGIKARLEARSKNWMEELPHVLWVHRTMIKSSNGDTPFSLTYGTEAVIPDEIGMPTI
ncbi:reverse transcriptase domain-containing protein [Tanacetum coccineum]